MPSFLIFMYIYIEHFPFFKTLLLLYTHWRRFKFFSHPPLTWLPIHMHTHLRCQGRPLGSRISFRLPSLSSVILALSQTIVFLAPWSLLNVPIWFFLPPRAFYLARISAMSWSNLHPIKTPEIYTLRTTQCLEEAFLALATSLSFLTYSLFFLLFSLTSRDHSERQSSIFTYQICTVLSPLSRRSAVLDFSFNLLLYRW